MLTYFLPMAIMIGMYSAIGLELWGQQAIGEATAVQADSIKSKRRVNTDLYHTFLMISILTCILLRQVVKMMVMVVIIFGVCWLPYHIYFIVSNVAPVINHSPYIQVSTFFQTITFYIYYYVTIAKEDYYINGLLL